MYTPRDGVLVQRVADELVLLDVRSGTYYGLNHVGVVVWEALAAGLELSGIVDAVRRRFEVDATRAERDVEQLVGDLLARSLITPK